MLTDERQLNSAEASTIAAGREPWRASLELAYGRRAGQTVPTLRKHVGPLRVLKGYRPDGADCWEQVIVHPPGGIASCDELRIAVGLDESAHTLLTTPGATKWYRAADSSFRDSGASQHLSATVARQASLEWMPLENIFYDGVQAKIDNSFELAEGAALIFAEVNCLGRPASQAPFRHGRINMHTRIARDRRLLFHERVALSGQDRALLAPAGLNGRACFGTLIAVPASPGHETWLKSLATEVRERASRELPDSELAVSALPETMLVRWRGNSAEAGWQAMRLAWQVLREPLLAMTPQAPRIWAC